jgi:RNA polymerase sigma-70 factor (ECF subfamily)
MMYALYLNLVTDPPAPAPSADVDEDRVQRLVDLARQGDTVAVQRLYRELVPRLFRVVRPFAASHADAEDVVQDAFVTAFGQLDRYERRAGTRFVAWLATIALNTARKQARRTQRFRFVEPDRLADLQEAARPGEAPDPGEARDRQRLTAALLAALADLPERERQIVVLQYGAELDATEIGELLGEAPATVRKVCQRQREKLLARLSRPARARPALAAVQEVTP